MYASSDVNIVYDDVLRAIFTQKNIEPVVGLSPAWELTQIFF